MRRPQHVVAKRTSAIGGIVVVGLTCATLASITRPFTGGAEGVTALPLAAAVVAMAVRTAASRRSANAIPSNQVPTGDTRFNRWLLAWVTVLVVIASWEVYCYASTPRSEHPTLSTLIDLLDSTRVGKALAFALWLALGCYLVLR